MGTTANMMTVPDRGAGWVTPLTTPPTSRWAWLSSSSSTTLTEWRTCQLNTANQRALKKTRIPEIADYIVQNDDYVFSSITVSVESADLIFHPSEVDENVGLLAIPMEAEWIVNDGQHRVAGIAEAIRRHDERRSDNLSVVILPNGGLERNQQVFSDLNRTVQKTSRSLDILFDHRVPLNRITNTCVERVELFKGKTDKERVSLARRSPEFATLSGLQAANTQLLPTIVGKAEIDAGEYQEFENLALAFWERAAEVVTPWAQIASGRVRPPDARLTYVSSYALALSAVASAGHTAIAAGDDWPAVLGGLVDVDWTKTNPEWQGICMHGDEVITRSPTRRATADLLRWKLGLGSQPAAQVI